MLDFTIDSPTANKSLNVVFRIKGENLDNLKELSDMLSSYDLTNPKNILLLPIMKEDAIKLGYELFITASGGIKAKSINLALWFIQKLYNYLGRGRYLTSFKLETPNG